MYEAPFHIILPTARCSLSGLTIKPKHCQLQRGISDTLPIPSLPQLWSLLNNSGFSGGEVPCQKLHAEACDKLYIPSPSLIQYKQHQNQMCFSWMKTSTVSTAENHSPCLTETSSKRLLHNQHRAAAVRWCSSEHLHQAMLIVLG